MTAAEPRPRPAPDAGPYPAPSSVRRPERPTIAHDPATGPGRWADMRETHISAVFLAGDFALKLKKPVRTAFLDYSTVEARDRACEEEVRLNRRLSPDVYLGVARIGLTDAGPGEPIVVMRRLRSADRLDRLLDRPQDLTAEIREIARTLAEFHSRCEPVVQSDAWERMRSRWRAECDQIDLLGDRIADGELRRAARILGSRFIEGRRALFEQRERALKHRDGHGDLRGEHIYLTSDGVRIIDCLEFDSDLRACDVVSDIAALVADCQRIDHPAAGAAIVDFYREFSAETFPPSLLHFYVAYRALVRAKVGALRARQQDRVDVEPPRLTAIAVEHLLAATPTMVCLGGLPGSGKSTVGEWLSKVRGDVLLSTDEIRHELLAGTAADQPEEWEHGAYAPEQTDAVYDELLRRADDALVAGYSVVLDASWRTSLYREAAHRVASNRQAVAIDVMCQVDERTAYARVRGHRDGFSQAGVGTRRAMKDAYDPWPAAHTLTTERPVEETAQDLVAVIDAALRAYSLTAGPANDSLAVSARSRADER